MIMGIQPKRRGYRIDFNRIPNCSLLSFYHFNMLNKMKYFFGIEVFGPKPIRFPKPARFNSNLGD